MSAEVKSMKEWALYYAELGLAVFPLAYRNKVPAIEGGCKAATTEKSKIERWWNQNPRYNIGIATGNKSNGLVVIDLDVDKIPQRKTGCTTTRQDGLPIQRA